MLFGFDRRLRSEAGSVLVAAILAMLLLGVFALSVSVLADLESRLGLNQKSAQQALNLAEAGLEHGRNMLRDAAGNFNAYIADATTRQLGVPGSGILLGPGRYWVRVDNDCAAPSGYSPGPGGPPFVPTVVEDSGGGTFTCSDTSDQNETVVLTAWSEVRDGANKLIGRARLRAHYTIGNPWKHSCYDQDALMCIEDAVGGCNNNPCIDPSDPRHPNGPARGELPIPDPALTKCGLQSKGGAIPDADVPDDVKIRMSGTAPCVMYPYYQWAIHTAAPTREICKAIPASGGGYDGTNECASPNFGTLAWTPGVAPCDTKPAKCHGLVFFGPGDNLGMGANITVGQPTGGFGGDIRCVGYQRDLSTADCYNAGLTQSDSKVIYVMGRITIQYGAVQGTVVLHGDGPTGSPNDFGVQGQAQITTHPCPAGSPSPSPGCGYPLAILAYNPNEAAPTVAAGQSMQLDLSNNSPNTLVSGIIYTGGTADFSPLKVNGSLIGHDVNITNTASRITYNETYGNAAPPPAFTNPTGGSGVQMFPATWVHCTYYANESAGAPTPCS